MSNTVVDVDSVAIRLVGDGVDPLAFTAKEVATVIANLEDAVKHVVFDIFADNEGKPYLSLYEIKNESLGLYFHPSIKNQIIAAFSVISAAINTSDFATLPLEALPNLKEVQKVIRKKNCTADFISQGEITASLTPYTEIAITKDIYKGRTTIYGKVTKAGGAEPKIWLSSARGYNIILTADEEAVMQLAKRLYQKVGLKGIATWSRQKDQIVDFKIHSIIDYEPTSIKETFKELQIAFGDSLDSIDSFDEAFLNE